MLTNEKKCVIITCNKILIGRIDKWYNLTLTTIITSYALLIFSLRKKVTALFVVHE